MMIRGQLVVVYCRSEENNENSDSGIPLLGRDGNTLPPKPKCENYCYCSAAFSLKSNTVRTVTD